ncbi:MAG TPA: hypothetical protein VLJ78_09460, partial [Microvirga sp.]|nr:hypothetical protein [Microvirga sp.]
MTDRHSTPALSALAGSIDLTDIGGRMTSHTATVAAADPAPPTIGDLDGSVVTAGPNQTVFLDQGLPATVTDPNGDLAYLSIYTGDQDERDVLGFHTDGNGIELVNREIHLDGHHVGTILEDSTGTSINISLTAAATPEYVQRLVRALTFTTSSTDVGSRKHVGIAISDQNPDHFAAEATVDVVIASSDVHVLTMGADDLAGTGAEDLFVARNVDLAAGDEIAGGDGNDTLRLDVYDDITFDLTQIAMSGIETILGSDVQDKIVISAEQLEDVRRIDGGNSDHNLLYLRGTGLDLTGKTITNFREVRLESDGAVVTTASKDLAMSVFGHLAENDTLILTSGELDATERLALHRQGIETITAVTDGVLTTTTHGAPEIANLGGDSVVSAGNNPVLLDEGADAIVAADDTLTWLEISVTTRTDGDDILGFANLNGVTVSGSTILLDGDPIGEIRLLSTGSHLKIALDDATADHARKLIGALTYRHAAGALDQDLAIRIDLKDASGRMTSQIVTVEANPIPNTPPVFGHLWGDVVEAAAGETVFLDRGQNATVVDQEQNLAYLDVSL